ncbi:MAG: cupredoxin domain-containing protein [Candidatus Nanoarchaeia archaeon]|nr:cupredoxin domain-containing protein [Candidatus Nanoarchaeia archaeon]MDD5588004.1 cupredoxin domain-containing protein [Candidatus Nanoarchaeia archaeon]
MKYIPILLVLSLLFLGGCAEKTGMVTAETIKVEVSDAGYSPAEVTINIGDTISWVNMGTNAHTITTKDRYLDLSAYPNQIVTKTFDKTGTYEYYCKMHPNMKGTVIVQ